MRITSSTAAIGRRVSQAVMARTIRRMAVPLAMAALAAPVALPGTAAASGGGCTRNGGGPINSCVQVDGSGLYVIDMKASVQLDPFTYVIGRLHLFGPAGFSLVKNFSYRQGFPSGQYAWTWGVNREVRPGPYCAQFEVNTGAGWRRSGNGPACLTVHP
jgi:hypothetical protein